jgi:uncharacterized protein
MKEGEEMQHWRRWLLLTGAGILVLGISYVVFSLVFLDFVVDLLWFDSLHYAGYFWLRFLYRYAVFAGATLLFFLVFCLNFWMASRYLGNTEPPPSDSSARIKQRYRDLARLFRSGSLKVYIPLSIVLAFIVAAPLFKQWEEALFYLFGRKTGAVDPVFGKDISYYLFSYPIYTLLQNRLLLAFLLLFVSLNVLYYAESRLLSRQEAFLPRGAKIHLSVLILLIFFIEIWDFRLQSYSLLYTNNHPLFFGPGYVELRVILPLIWLTLLLLMGTAFSLIYTINTRRGLKVLILFALGFALALGARESTVLPQYVEKYIVKPNEISRERPFIENSIQSTLAAYNLTNVDTREYNLKRVPTLATDPNVQASIRNIPVWDRDLLVDVYKQVQEIRPYYNFSNVNVDRYTVNGLYQQVFVAPRELDLKDLPASAQNWVNEYLKYTHGYGAVMTPAAQYGEEPMTWFIHNIPPESDYGFKIQQPGIYYGMQTETYTIAPNDLREFDYPEENTTVSVDYRGSGGVPLTSLFRRLLFSVYFKEKNILFTTKTNKDTRILFRRNIIESISTLTPYLKLDEDPYVVVTSQGLFWIQDAYTTSNWYPNAQPYEQKFNYIRNSVKVVVDAYNGTVSYYTADAQDPIIRAYSIMYPGLFQDLEQMPAELKAHIRYPKDIFDAQMSIYAIYHQNDPDGYYKQEDAWEFAKTYHGNKSVNLRPYYLTLNLINENKHDFILLRSMSPKNLDVLRALVVVGCDPPHYGKMVIYSFPKGIVVYGPSQISALINQDPYISQQFTLWDQVGSEVERGNMIIIPIGGTVVYVQPVYLKSSARLKIPELTRLIVSQGDVVVMDASLQKALGIMEERLRARVERIKERQQQYQSQGGQRIPAAPQPPGEEQSPSLPQPSVTPQSPVAPPPPAGQPTPLEQQPPRAMEQPPADASEPPKP